MKHVTDRLAAFIGGALPAAEAEAVRDHLQGCAACREVEVQERAAWDALDAIRPVSAGVGVWPAVRARTFGAGRQAWFFGRSPASRLGLAAATLAVGILLGRLTGVAGGPRTSVAEDDSGLAGLWLEESAWHSGSDGGLSGLWLAVATVDEQGGAK